MFENAKGSWPGMFARLVLIVKEKVYKVAEKA
jgi:hypothetical protein